MVVASSSKPTVDAGLKPFFKGKVEELELLIKDKGHNLRRLEAQRNELNTQGECRCPSSTAAYADTADCCASVRLLREELQLLQEPGSYVGEVIKVCCATGLFINFNFNLSVALQVMGKTKVLVKVHPEGKYVVDLDKSIEVDQLRPGSRVALRNDSYTLHLVLPTKVDPLVSLMKVEKVPDSTYDMIGGAEQQIKEIKEASVFCSAGLVQALVLVRPFFLPACLPC
jgi:26S proteasome regulatory subunit T6